jgi:hypothetical protein
VCVRESEHGGMHLFVRVLGPQVLKWVPTTTLKITKRGGPVFPNSALAAPHLWARVLNENPDRQRPPTPLSRAVNEYAGFMWSNLGV